MAKQNPGTLSYIQNRLDAMRAGFQTDLTAKQSITVEGSTMTQPQILSKIDAIEKLLTDVDTAEAAKVAAIAAKDAGMPEGRAFLDSLEAALKVAFGKNDPRLLDFGIKLPKAKAKPSVETQATALAQRRDTRKARGRKGKAQAAAITTAGKPGLALVSPSGALVPGLLTGPVPPGSGTPVDVAPASSGTAPAQAGTSDPAAQQGDGTPPAK